MSAAPSIAIVHDWLIEPGGAEQVLAEAFRLFPGAALFTLIDKMRSADRAQFGLPRSRTSVLQAMPGVATYYRSLLPLMPAATRTLDVRGCDLVLSISHAVAKNVRTEPGQRHLCLCLSPMRYAWDLREQYLSESGLDRGVKGLAARWLLNRLQRWDARGATRVTEFIAISRYIADRVRRAYGRESTVVYPPVDTEYFTPGAEIREEFYVTASRLVPYKRMDLIVRAFAGMPARRLVVIGDGPDAAKVRAAIAPNVTFLGRQPREVVRGYLRRARAFVFAAEEDFGIAPIEAQACGTPVIAFGRGGALETIRGLDDPRPTGVFFAEQVEEGVRAAVQLFEENAWRIDGVACRENAERFAAARFRDELSGHVTRSLTARR
jgi:glycosyltransferase involved in cell wall biosynthesis